MDAGRLDDFEYGRGAASRLKGEFMTRTNDPRFANAPVDLFRRAFLKKSSAGFGALALAMLAKEGLAIAPQDSRPQDSRPTRTPPWKLEKQTAQRVIVIFLSGGLSQLDLFDEKPLLTERRGEQLPDSIRKGGRITGLTDRQGALPVVGSKFEFRNYGKCGMRLSECLPEIASVADQLTLIRSMQTDHVLHEAAMTILFTGTPLLGRPSWGSWTSYGLGSSQKNLPEFVVLLSNGDGATPLHPRLWHNGFLEGKYQGVNFRSGPEPVLYVKNPPGINEKTRARQLDALKKLDDLESKSFGDPETTSRLASYEMAAKMQLSVPELTDISKEPQEILDLYGAEPGKESFANNCLLARRLLERGVKFVQLCDGGWDTHFNIPTVLPKKFEQVDRPTSALLKDLKERGLLDDTIVVFTGEFGRTPYCEGPLAFNSYGRDHNNLAMSILAAGGGFRRGYTHGATDDWGWSATENIVHMHDFHATVMACLGIDHKKLVMRHQGRDFRLTDVAGNVIPELLA